MTATEALPTLLRIPKQSWRRLRGNYANIKGANLEGANLIAANLECANLKEATLYYAKLEKANYVDPVTKKLKSKLPSNHSSAISLTTVKLW